MTHPKLNKYDRNVRLSKIKNKSKPEMATHYAEEIKFNQTINQQMAESTLIQQNTSIMNLVKKRGLITEK